VQKSCISAFLDVLLQADYVFPFSNQAGAKHVYAVEASEMAEYARKLIAGNPSLGERITVRLCYVLQLFFLKCHCLSHFA